MEGQLGNASPLPSFQNVPSSEVASVAQTSRLCRVVLVCLTPADGEDEP